MTDPRNLVTTYGYDGLDNQVLLVSPDTGTTTRTFDAAGNVLTSTDARGVLATYAYDHANRVMEFPRFPGQLNWYRCAEILFVAQDIVRSFGPVFFERVKQ